MVSMGTQHAMENCSHQKADTCIVLHLQDALMGGLRNILVRSLDTYVLVILISVYHKLTDQYPGTELWLLFGIGRKLTYYHSNTVCQHLGRPTSEEILLFHSITDCDTFSYLYGTGKRTVQKAWMVYPDMTKQFQKALTHPFHDFSEGEMNTLERFIILCYDNTSDLISVNECRKTLFCRNRSLENTLPTQVSSFILWLKLLISM